MKMWFPNRIQWIVMWLGLAASFLLFTSPSSSDRITGIFLLIATVFIVWMIEGYRRKSTQKNP